MTVRLLGSPFYFRYVRDSIGYSRVILVDDLGNQLMSRGMILPVVELNDGITLSEGNGTIEEPWKIENK